MMFNQQEYEDSIYQFNQSSNKLLRPSTLFSKIRFDNNVDDMKEHYLIQSFNKKGSLPNCYFIGSFLYSDQNNTLIQNRNYAPLLVENHNSLLGDKYEYYVINPVSLLYTHIQNHNKLNKLSEHVFNYIPFKTNMEKLYKHSDLLNDQLRTMIIDCVNIEQENKNIEEMIRKESEIQVIDFKDHFKSDSIYFFNFNSIEKKNLLITIPDNFKSMEHIRLFFTDLMREGIPLDILSIKCSQQVNLFIRDLIYDKDINSI